MLYHVFRQSAVLIVRQLLKSTSSTISLLERLEEVYDLWGEVLPYISEIPPSIVERTVKLLQVIMCYFLCLGHRDPATRKGAHGPL